MAGTLHVLTQATLMNDLGWFISGVGYVGANLHYCASWDGNGIYIRSIAAISLSTNPTYTLNCYLGCNYTYRPNRIILAPSGSWYISSQAYVDNQYGSIIQKVHSIEPRSSQWVGFHKMTVV